LPDVDSPQQSLQVIEMPESLKFRSDDHDDRSGQPQNLIIKSDRLPVTATKTGDRFPSIAPLDPIDPSEKQKQQKVAIEHHQAKAYCSV